MPVFNLELKFDDKGALQAVSQIDKVTGAANGATVAVDKLGKSAASNGQALSNMGNTGGSAADAIANKMKKAAAEVLALVGAFKAVQGAMDFMNRGLEFNASLEQSQIGIASLITSMVKLQDAQGNILEGQEKYNAAQGMAVELMQKIQQLGLQTTADSKSIVEGFQSILAPALEAGIALEKIPEFAVQGAQALQTLGVPLNQMRTELDALLTGSVNLSQDILAPKLFADVQGNIKEYIQNLKQAGKLEEEIFKRLEPYNLALKDTENTWAAISSNLGEALDKIAGDTSLNYIKAMKQSLSDINNLIIDTKTGKIGQDFQNIASLLADIQDWIGNKIVSSVQTLIGYAKDINFFFGSDMGQSALSAFTTALKVASGALTGFAIARATAFAKDKSVSLINASKQATDNYKQSVIAAAQAQKNAAVAELQKAQAYRRSAQGLQEFKSSWQARQAMLANEVALINQVTVAEQNLAKARAISTATATIKGGFKSLINVMGGPLNVVIMSAIAGLTYLATKEDDSADATDRHTAAQTTYTNVIQGVIDANGKLTRSLTEVEAAEARAAERRFLQEKNSEIRSYASELSEIEDEFNSMWNAEAENGEISGNLLWQDEAIGLVKKYFDEYRNGQSTLDETKVKLDAIRQAMPFGNEDSGIAKWIDKFIGDVGLKELEKELKDTQTALDGTAKKSKQFSVANNDTEKSIKNMTEALDKVNTTEKANVNTLEGALKWLEKRNSTTEEGKKIQEAMAKATDMAALATLDAAIATAEFNAAAANTALLTNDITDGMIQVASEANHIVVQLKSARESIAKGIVTPEWGGVGKKDGKRKSGGSGMSAEKADEKWKELTQQLAQLEGKSTSASASLDKTLKSVEETGKAAKKSASEIQKMKDAFIEASDKKALQDLNKELLQLEGNSKAVQEIERAEKTDQLRAKIADIRSLSEDEKNILLNRAESAVRNEIKVKDLKTAVDFFKDLESLGGEYGQSLELQNQLIENQAALYRDNLGPEFHNYVIEWERLKILNNDKSFFAGLERGVRKFGADYGDMSKQVEQFTTNMGSHISNTLADAFMKGKFSAQDFFSSLISMAAQAASNAFIGQIFSGIGSAFSGMFSSGKYNGLNASAAQGAANTSGYAGMGMRWSGGSAHGNVFSGGNLSDFSNSIVSRPTFFGFGTHFSKYARGAGLMGEAGPEAIMPLSRTKSGDLGVQMVGGWNTSPIVNVKVVNESGNPVDAQSQVMPNGSGGFDLEIILAQVEQGLVSRAKQGKSQLMQYQETAYGMNRGAVLARARGRN